MRRYCRSVTSNEAYREVAAYTLALAGRRFLHQHVVDAFAVQTARPAEKPIRVVQALVGLYLHVEHGVSGRQVQRVHQILANRRPEWPTLPLPDERGQITVLDVVAQPAGGRRDDAIEAWAVSTWDACRGLLRDVEKFLSSNDVTAPAK
jgi:hypothetical protein